MIQLVGFVLVLLIVSGALMVSGGPAVFAALPFELALIGGAAIGTVMIGNSTPVAKAACWDLAGRCADQNGQRLIMPDYSL